MRKVRHFLLISGRFPQEIQSATLGTFEPTGTVPPLPFSIVAVLFPLGIWICKAMRMQGCLASHIQSLVESLFRDH